MKKKLLLLSLFLMSINVTQAISKKECKNCIKTVGLFLSIYKIAQFAFDVRVESAKSDKGLKDSAVEVSKKNITLRWNQCNSWVEYLKAIEYRKKYNNTKDYLSQTRPVIYTKNRCTSLGNRAHKYLVDWHQKSSWFKKACEKTGVNCRRLQENQ